MASHPSHPRETLYKIYRQLVDNPVLGDQSFWTLSEKDQKLFIGLLDHFQYMEVCNIIDSANEAMPEGFRWEIVISAQCAELTEYSSSLTTPEWCRLPERTIIKFSHGGRYIWQSVDPTDVLTNPFANAIEAVEWEFNHPELRLNLSQVGADPAKASIDLYVIHRLERVNRLTFSMS